MKNLVELLAQEIGNHGMSAEYKVLQAQTDENKPHKEQDELYSELESAIVKDAIGFAVKTIFKF